MPDYAYIAREASGQQIQGVLTAGTERDAVGQLAARSLFPIEIRVAESSKVQQASKRRRVSGRILATFYTQLADLLRAGVPLGKFGAMSPMGRGWPRRCDNIPRFFPNSPSA